ncbi:MAG: phosphatidylserine/phosphatidylglycerophosphate/cardiolipin synthase family protein [Bdellovibrionaceae bacterium]|nr:phosphatidylserine/phosphatidylglycerophosphate/cardiolipin synthase family protein [Pseudobdellovibrionaceae bacterium]
MAKILRICFVFSIFTSSIQCSHQWPTNSSGDFSEPRTITSTNDGDWLQKLPGDEKPFIQMVAAKVKRSVKGSSANEKQQQIIVERIAKYMGYLLYNYEKIHANDGGTKAEKAKLYDKVVKNSLDRLFKSSTQFILCEDVTDYACLEKTPIVEPSSESRQEDASLHLGERVDIKDSLDGNIEWYFNTKIMIPEDKIDIKQTVANVLMDKIKNEGKTAIYTAMYGMDDVTADNKRKSLGSLNGVYNALIDQINEGVDVRAVFDEKGFAKGVTKPLLFTYVEPNDAKKREKWILSSANDPKDDTRTKLAFQYSEGTQGLIQALALNASTDEEATGRIEWKNDGIMHNKFFVFQNGKQYSVWTGTANISRTCMGTERNSNMSVFIKNNEIAQSYIDEFNEMYEFQDPTPKNTGNDFVGMKSKDFPYGRFHGNKRPNTKRYFYFEKDKTTARVYFSPTDDAEHRAILPLLLDARAGDTLRISMFGAAGIEYVRALQLAASRGVKVEVIVDSPTACGPGSWAGLTGDATLLEENPFKASAKVAIKKNNKSKGNTWKQNHQKIGVLLRDGKAQAIIFGSQNWSNSGNDKNDENLMALSRNDTSLQIAEEFDKHFTTFLWPNGETIPESGCSGDAGDGEDVEEN